jgi:hypothetical protein
MNLCTHLAMLALLVEPVGNVQRTGIVSMTAFSRGLLKPFNSF